MKQYKICLLGAPGVGKTSLVRRFVHSCFFERYHSTIGVKIDKKAVTVDGTDVELIVWDVQGEDRFRSVLKPYLRGMAGYVLVVDGSRPESQATARDLQARIALEHGDVPHLLLWNKSDIAGPAPTDYTSAGSLATLSTSALTGENVANAFETLASALLAPGQEVPGQGLKSA